MSTQETIFGIHALQAILNAHSDCIVQLYIDERRQDKRIQSLLLTAKDKNIEVRYSNRDELDKVSHGANHQGAVAICRMPQAKDDSYLEKMLEKNSQPLLLVLDGVQDPHNLGACLRTADATGVTAVIVPKDRAVSLTSTVIKVASGAAFTVPFVAVTNLSRAIRRMQEKGVWFVGTDGGAEQSLYELTLAGSIAIVMGAEGSGLRRLTKELCDYLVRLPMLGSVESLNVSVATGICLYEALRQRSQTIG